jgi:NTP pyrophosphatase (non-canonical NTP hydrolase)
MSRSAWTAKIGELQEISMGVPDDGIERVRTGVGIREIQREVDRYISQFKEGYFPPLVNLARLTEEVGELARELNHRYGPKKKKADEPEGEIAMELADILFVLIVLANQMDIDLQEAVERTMEKYRVRDADRWERKD